MRWGDSGVSFYYTDAVHLNMVYALCCVLLCLDNGEFTHIFYDYSTGTSKVPVQLLGMGSSNQRRR